MYRFDSLEAVGVAVAGMTDKADPDPVLPLECHGVGMVKQVHGNRIVAAEDLPESGEPPEADGLTVANAAVAIGVNVADCVPVLLVDPEVPCAAAAHAGRRGLEADIVGEAVRALESRGAAAARMHAAIGPSAGPCCYEVSPAMAAGWASHGLPAQGRLLDLWAAASMQLQQRGVPATQIATSRICTICGDRFFSYRSGDEQPRNIAYLAL